MRVSLVSSADGYPAVDALANLARLLLRRGDDVRVFTTNTGVPLPQPLPPLIQGAGRAAADLLRLQSFAESDLFIYHIVTPHALFDSLLSLERGAVILYFQPETVIDENARAGDALPRELVRLASASDVVVVEDDISASALRDTGGIVPDRLRIVPAAVSLSEFVPGLPDAALRQELGLQGRRVMLAHMPDDVLVALSAASDFVARIREGVPDAVLAVAPHFSAPQQATGGYDEDAIRLLPPTGKPASVYQLADVYLASSGSRASMQRMLEAMACGIPVLDAEWHSADSGPEAAQAAIELLTDDVRYGEEVRRSLDIASQHSLDSFWQEWSAIISTACGWLPVHLSADPSSVRTAAYRASGVPEPAAESETAVPVDLGVEMEQLKTMASVMLRDYEVRSPTPMFGPFIAWVRRNLTSHLRKPYLDPTFEQQEAFNLRAVSALEDLAAQLGAYKQSRALKDAALRRDVLQVLDQIDALLDGLDGAEPTAGRDEQVAAMRAAVAQARTLLPDDPGDSRAGLED